MTAAARAAQRAGQRVRETIVSRDKGTVASHGESHVERGVHRPLVDERDLEGRFQKNARWSDGDRDAPEGGDDVPSLL
ncbi:MAG TPA: hypothetical protein VG845_06825 [Dehalococcoidia bacterium]|nr:hypothetical protein [Dehalococcoidia bacterium]